MEKEESSQQSSRHITLTDENHTSHNTLNKGTHTQRPYPEWEDIEWNLATGWSTIKDTIDHSSHTHFTFTSKEIMERLRHTNPDIDLNRKVWEGGYPNRWGAKIPIKPNWNLQLFEEELQGYEDIEIIEWMKYGWPIGRLPTLPDPDLTFKNHKGATDYPEALQKYIKKETGYGAIIGPFTEIPFPDKVGISPLSTRPKKESEERRVILDLSFPPEKSVNDGIIKDNYLGFHAKLTFPRTDELAHRIFQLGKEALLYKVDLHRYFRQLNLDPGDYSLLGYIVDNKLYFDKMVPMGVRTGPYIAQRVTSAIKWIIEQLQYFLLNYVDDFVGAEIGEKAWKAFNTLTELLEKINAQTSPEKVIPPTHRLEFLGTTFDTQKMTMEVPGPKLEEILKELENWQHKVTATRQEIESLIGKLQFAARCVRPGRIFLARLINWLKGTDRKQGYPIPTEAKKDIAWWYSYLREYNGISLVWLHCNPNTDEIIATDACLTGFGGTSGHEYFKGQFPKNLQGKNIALLEILAVLAAVRLWKHKLRGKFFWIHVDNEAVSTILNTGASKNEKLQEVLREIAYIAAQEQFVIKAKHIEGVTNRVPDWLSRWGDREARENFQKHCKTKNLKEVITPTDCIEIKNIW